MDDPQTERFHLMQRTTPNKHQRSEPLSVDHTSKRWKGIAFFVLARSWMLALLPSIFRALELVEHAEPCAWNLLPKIKAHPSAEVGNTVSQCGRRSQLHAGVRLDRRTHLMRPPPPLPPPPSLLSLPSRLPASLPLLSSHPTPTPNSLHPTPTPFSL